MDSEVVVSDITAAAVVMGIAVVSGVEFEHGKHPQL